MMRTAYEGQAKLWQYVINGVGGDRRRVLTLSRGQRKYRCRHLLKWIVSGKVNTILKVRRIVRKVI